MARSNVSNSLKELLGWKLIRRVPVMGDRRDHYEAETDLWEMVTRIAQGRKEREIDPAAAALRACLAEAKGDPRVSPVAHAAARRDGPVPRDGEPLVRSDAVGAGAQDHGADADGREGGEFPELRPQGRGRRAARPRRESGRWRSAGGSRRTVIPFPGAARAPAPAAEIGDLRFRTLIGEAAWAGLPEAVRARFGKRIAGCAAALYAGEVVECRISRGRLAARPARRG